MLLAEMLEKIPGVDASGRLEIRIGGIAYDSRKVRPGSLFVALRGEKTDGQRYLEDAVERGAVALASDRAIHLRTSAAVILTPDARKFLAQVSKIFYGNPASRLKLAGVTGTNGKTTTCYILDSILREGGLKSCLIGTVGMKIADRMLPSDRTTPEAPDLMDFLREAVRQGCTHGVLEVSSHALALKRVFGMPISVAVFSNLTPDHLDFHGDMETYYESKKILFTPEGENLVQHAAINLDDPWGLRLTREAGCPFVTYGFASDAEIRADKVDCRIDGTSLVLETPDGKMNLNSLLVGLPNVYNVLAAVAAARGLGVDQDAIVGGVERLAGVPGRMERVEEGQPFSVLVDYAHTPDALSRTLETVRQLPHKQIITVFGCGGDRDRSKRPVMGRIAASMSDLVIATSDNPRSEDPRKILAEIEPGLRDGNAKTRLVVDRREAIGQAISQAAPGDVVLIAGKGHESYQVIGESIHPFDDRAVAREELGNLKKNTKGSDR